MESISGVCAGGKAPLLPREGLSTPKPHKGDANEAASSLPSPFWPRWLLRAQHRALPPSPPSCSVPEEGVKQPQSCAWQLLWQPYIFLMIPNDLLAFALIYGFLGCCSLTRLPSAPKSRHIPCGAEARVRLGRLPQCCPWPRPQHPRCFSGSSRDRSHRPGFCKRQVLNHSLFFPQRGWEEAGSAAGFGDEQIFLNRSQLEQRTTAPREARGVPGCAKPHIAAGFEATRR